MRKYRLLILPPLFIVFLSLSYFLYLNETSNFHPVTAGEAYRSAQLSRSELERHIQEYGLRSILNLRGENPDKEWYRDEISVSKEYNLAHYDIALSAEREPTKEEVEKLMGIFRTAPRPILIHCMGGADRSGLVSAMWKVSIDKETKKEADGQLSIRYGHIPIGKTTAMDSFFENWNPSSPMNLN